MKPKKTQSGFSLMELLVALAIVGILSTIVVANYREGNKRKSVELAADLVANALMEAQNDALSGLQLNTSCQVAGIPDKAATSFWANFQQGINTYTIAAYDKCATMINLKTLRLPQNTRVRTGGLVLDGTPVNILGIVFLPPFGYVRASIGAAPNVFQNASIIVESNDGTYPRTVTVDGVSSRVQ